MNRREFLQLSAILAVGASTGSCAQLTPRYVSPKKLTRPEEKLLLKNASVVEVSQGIVMRGCRILIQKGKIVDVFQQPWTEPVDAERELDLGGAYVMPGIINAHCHMSIPGGIGFGPGFIMAYKRQLERNAEECVKHGVTTVRDMLAISDFLDELRLKISQGDIVGPRILSCCAMDVDDGYGDKMGFFRKERFWQEANNPEEGREAVRFAVDQGADFIKLFQQPKELFLPGEELPVMGVDTLREIREEADRKGRYVALHHTEISGLRNALSAGIRSLEHMVTDTLLGEAEIRRIVDGGQIIIPTATVAFALAYEKRGDPNWGKGFSMRIAAERKEKMPELIEEFCEPELVKSTLKFFKKLSNPDSYEAWHPLPWPDPATMNAAANIGSTNTNRLHEAGVTFGCGNDGGVPLAFPGAMGVEMVLLQEQGLKPADILRMATINNARLLQMDRDIGTVEKGKVADLVVFQENPLETLYNALYPQKVFQGGRLAFSA